jgi:hypothetical protein
MKHPVYVFSVDTRSWLTVFYKRLWIIAPSLGAPAVTVKKSPAVPQAWSPAAYSSGCNNPAE